MTNSCSLFNRYVPAAAVLLALCFAPVFAQNASTGKIITFQVPGGISGPFFINNSLAVAGSYMDPGPQPDGFVRSPGGVLTSFTVPGSQSVWVSGIDNSGEITGSYTDSNPCSTAFCARRRVRSRRSIFLAPF